jgi:peptidoglycan/xylan/chitin deacetylase (PgdA/CDA1 family)
MLLVSVEEWNPREPMPRTVSTPPAGGAPPSPDIPNWTWHEYGNRVGFWRLTKLLDALDIKASMSINGCAIETYQPIAAAAHQRGWEFIGHGYTQKNLQKVEDERSDIRKTAGAIQAFTGQAPKGWLGPGLTETWNTPDILVEEGFKYVCDWLHDDQPTVLKTKTGPLISVPFTQECNDIAILLSQHHPAAEFRSRAIDQCDQLLEDAAHSARVMAIVVHPFIMGVAHRLRYLKEALEHIASKPGTVFMTGGEIHDWYLTQNR